MRDHQKYFAVEDAQGRLAPYFLAVLNTNGDPAGLIRHGNERVLRARFRDARFFWDTDQKIPLRQRVERRRLSAFVSCSSLPLRNCQPATRAVELSSRLSPNGPAFLAATVFMHGIGLGPHLRSRAVRSGRHVRRTAEYLEELMKALHVRLSGVRAR